MRVAPTDTAGGASQAPRVAESAPSAAGGAPAPASGAVERVPRPSTRTLVMWSGGLDSTYALVRVLRETRDEVIAHHVHIVRQAQNEPGLDPRSAYEALAVARLLGEIRARLRPFEFSESRVDLSTLRVAASDTTTAMFVAAQVALSHSLTPFDRIVLGVDADIDREWQPQTYAYAFRRLVTVHLLKAVWESEEVPHLFLWNPRPTRLEEARYLGEALVRLTASCRRPRERRVGFAEPRYEACGECAGCQAAPRTHDEDRQAGESPPQ